MKTYGSLVLSEDKKTWAMKAEPHVAIKVKSIFPRIPKYASVYTFANSPDVCLDLHWFMQRYPLSISENDLSCLTGSKNSEIEKRNDLEQIFMPDYTPKHHPIKGTLRDYQSIGVDLVLKNKELLCGDVVGLGKTLIGIGMMAHAETLPLLVVVQTHLPKQWLDQINKFLDVRVHVIKGTTPYSLPPADVYIMKYSCLAGWSDTYGKKWFKAVVFDEVQELRREESAKYKAASVLCSNAEYRLGLSATPVYNFGSEMFNVMNLIAPDKLGSKSDFMREWAGYGSTIKDPKALGTYLRENFLFLRRTREEVGRELPVINKIVHRVDYDEAAVEKMEDLAKILAVRVTTGSFVERGQAARELDIMVRQATGVSKARYVAEYVKMLLDGGEPVLLAGWHRNVYEIWEEAFKEHKPVWYTGTESLAQKEEAKRSFIAGETNLLIISLRSGVGLDGLQERCKVVVFGELDWSPGIHEQLTGRVNRDGQQDQVTAIYLVSDSGSDPLMVDLLGLKSAQAQGIVDPLASLQEVHSDDSRIKMLAERILKK